MLIISRTPVRISFFGGGTDYPIFYHEHPGAVLGTTIDQYTYISVKTLKSSFFDHNIHISYSKTELVKDVKEIKHPSIRECLKYKGIQKNLEIHIFSDLPARTGLGSSSSFTVGFLNALDALKGEKRSKYKLAQEACHVEQRCIQENVGSQDQFHAAFGGFNRIEFQGVNIQVRPIALSPEKKQCLEDHLLLFFTGRTRHASQIVEEQIQRTKSQANQPYLREMLALVGQAEETLVKTPEDQVSKAFGQLLHENWNLKKQLSSKVSNSQIDAAYQAAMDAGAYGGKLCGAGNGGFLAFFVPPENQRRVREVLKELKEVNFHFEDQGSTIVYKQD